MWIEVKKLTHDIYKFKVRKKSEENVKIRIKFKSPEL